MSNICEAVLVSCIDFCIHQRKDGRGYIGDFVKKLGVDCDLILCAGSILELVMPTHPKFKEKLLNDLRISIYSHKAKTIYIINHENCSSYARFTFLNKKEIKERHYNDLKKAREVLSEEFPKVEIKLYYARVEEDTEDSFIIRQVD